MFLKIGHHIKFCPRIVAESIAYFVHLWLIHGNFWNLIISFPFCQSHESCAVMNIAMFVCYFVAPNQIWQVAFAVGRCWLCCLSLGFVQWNVITSFLCPCWWNNATSCTTELVQCKRLFIILIHVSICSFLIWCFVLYLSTASCSEKYLFSCIRSFSDIVKFNWTEMHMFGQPVSITITISDQHKMNGRKFFLGMFFY